MDQTFQTNSTYSLKLASMTTGSGLMMKQIKAQL